MGGMSDAPKPDRRTVERFRVAHAAASRRGLWLRPLADARSGRGAGPGAGSDAARAALLPRLPRRGGAALAVAHRAQHLDRPAGASAAEKQPLEAAENQPAEGPDPEQSALAGDRRRQVAAALAALPAEMREILVLREIEDLPYKQIAAVLDLPIGTVMSRLARARESWRSSSRPPGKERPWTARPVRRWSTPMSTAS